MVFGILTVVPFYSRQLFPISATAAVPANIRRASSGQFPGPASGKCVKQSMSVSSIGNGAPLPSNRSVSLTADHIERKENSLRKFKRSQSTKKREGTLNERGRDYFPFTWR